MDGQAEVNYNQMYMQWTKIWLDTENEQLKKST